MDGIVRASSASDPVECICGNWKASVLDSVVTFYERTEGGKWFRTPGSYYTRTLAKGAPYPGGLCIDGGSNWTISAEVMEVFMAFITGVRRAQEKAGLLDYDSAVVTISKDAPPLKQGLVRMEVNPAATVLFSDEVLVKGQAVQELAQSFADVEGVKVWWAATWSGTSMGSAEPTNRTEALTT